MLERTNKGVISLGVKPGQYKARDFIIRHGLCSECRYFLRVWPGWPLYDEWQEAYPGDIIIPNHEYFRHSTKRWLSNPDFKYHKGFDYPKEVFSEIRRYASGLTYQSCELCALIHSALLDTLSTYRYVYMSFWSTSEEGASFFVWTEVWPSSGFRVMLSLNRVVDTETYAKSLDFLPDYTGSRKSMIRLRERLNECCRLRGSQKTDWLPTRLVEVRRDLGEPPSVRIVTSRHIKHSPPYLTLSHRWGRKAGLVLMESNRDKFEHSIPWAFIPKTYRDSLHLTLELGYNYIWIDSLCILQDSITDWSSESLKMSEVYGNTSLNIFAGCAADDQSGLFRLRDSLTSAGSIVRCEWPGMSQDLWHCQVSLANVYRDRHLHPPNSYLSTRGWVVQEELLPSSVVYFGKRDIFWACIHGHASEFYPQQDHAFPPEGRLADQLGKRIDITLALHPNRDLGPDDKVALLEKIWYYTIQRYNICDFKFETDKLIAISGVAQRICSLLHLDTQAYLAGIWQPFLLKMIFWERQISSHDSRFYCYNDYLAPSWSWASVKGNIKIPNWKFSTYLAEIIRTRVETQGGPFGKVLSGYLDISAPVWEVNTFLKRHKRHEGDLKEFSLACGHRLVNSEGYRSVVGKDPEGILDFPSRHGTEDQPCKFFFVAIGFTVWATSAYEYEGPPEPLYGDIVLHCLMLQETSDRKGEFRRVGTARLSLESMMHHQCSGHVLPEKRFLERHSDSSSISKSVQDAIHAHASHTSLLGRHKTSFITGFESRNLEWKSHGDIKWPKTFLHPSDCGILQDDFYTIRLV